MRQRPEGVQRGPGGGMVRPMGKLRPYGRGSDGLRPGGGDGEARQGREVKRERWSVGGGGGG